MNNLGFANMANAINRREEGESALSWKTRSDYWANALSEDGLSLNPIIGTGGIPKDFSCANTVDGVAGLGTPTINSLNMADSTAIYEYYLEVIIDDITANYNHPVFQCGATATAVAGIFLLKYRDVGGYTLYLGDGTSRDIRSVVAAYFKNGLNKILIRINCATKGVYVNINGVEDTYTHSVGNLLNNSGKVFCIGINSASNFHLSPVYFYFKKNELVLEEYLFDSPMFDGAKYVYRDLRGTSDYFSIASPPIKQSLINKYKSGFRLFVQRRINEPDLYCPIPLDLLTDVTSLSEYEYLGTILPNQIGYHIFDYIEMPDLPIFDTTSRTYWKASIENDPFYVGGTAGKERYFHMNWLNYTWLNAHIEDDYLYKIVTRNIIKTSELMDDAYFQLKDLILVK